MGALLSGGETLCFLGDSITAADPGYTRLLAALLAAGDPQWALDFVYAGIGGNRVGDLLARLDRDVLARQPDWVTVSIGINDVWHRRAGRGTSDSDFEAGYRTLLQRLTAAGRRVVVVLPTVIGEDLESAENVQLQVLIAAQRALCAEFGLVLCDMHGAWRQAITARRAAIPAAAWPLGPDGQTRFLTTDGVHCNAAGNALMALRLMATLEGRE